MFVSTLINLLYNLSSSNKYFIRFRGNKQQRKMNKTKVKRPTTSITQNLEIKNLTDCFRVLSVFSEMYVDMGIKVLNL